MLGGPPHHHLVCSFERRELGEIFKLIPYGQELNDPHRHAASAKAGLAKPPTRRCKLGTVWSWDIRDLAEIPDLLQQMVVSAAELN